MTIEEDTPLEPGTPEVRALFGETAFAAYLDTATYGLPPLATLEVLRQALKDWQLGRASWREDWEPAGEQCRELISPLLGAPSSEIALMPAVSVGVGTVAAALPPRSEVVVPDDEFQSVLFPLLVAGVTRDVRVRRVPFESLADAITAKTTLVATSHVRSNGGRLQDLAILVDACRAAGAELLVDATHSAGVLPIGAAATGLDYVVCSAYKHLLCPRGVSFLRVSPTARLEVVPICASWRAVKGRTSYGGSLDDLMSAGPGFDVALAWHAWLGAVESLAFLNRFSPESRLAGSVGLADRFAHLTGLHGTGSSVLGVPLRVNEDAIRVVLREAKISAALVGGQLRVAFHVYNTTDDVDYAAGVLEPFVQRPNH